MKVIRWLVEHDGVCTVILTMVLMVFMYFISSHLPIWNQVAAMSIAPLVMCTAQMTMWSKTSAFSSYDDDPEARQKFVYWGKWWLISWVPVICAFTAPFIWG